MMMEDKILMTARYVEGDLDEAELAEFESQLPNDVELQQHLADYHEIHRVLKMKFSADEQDQSFKERLAINNQKYFSEQPRVVSIQPYFKWISGIAAILVIGLFIWAPWNANLYQKFAGNEQMMVTERGEGQLSAMDKAAARFNEKDFPAAKQLLQKLNAEQPNDALIAYYYGRTLMETDSLVAARQMLTQLSAGESAFKYDATFAIALSYLKENKKAQCKVWLQKIPAGVNRYDEAQKLMAKL